MFCPFCGTFQKSDDANFCHQCGSELRTSVSYGPAPYTPVEKSKSKGNGVKALAVIVVALLFGVIVIGLMNYDQDDEEDKFYIQTLNTGSYLELRMDFLPEKNIFTVYFNEDDQMVFRLDPDIAEKYDNYVWRFYDMNAPSSSSKYTYTKYAGETITKSDPWLTFLTPRVGEFKVSVECYSDVNGRLTYGSSYSGNVSYFGTITKEYTWTYLGKEYTAITSFDLSDYIDYKNQNPGSKRTVLKYSNVLSFVTYDDPAIKDLALSLSLAYDGDPAVKDGDFANFILAFVQICFDYPPYSGSSMFWADMSADRYLYGYNEYFAYPLETIFYDMGDCEDTSILASTLFTACGFKSAVAIVPGHALAGVALEDYNVGSHSPAYEVLSQTIDGLTYYACETTTDTFLSAGLSLASGSSGVPFSNYMDTYSGGNRLGFYLVTSS
jgi:hypothetical protein